MKTIETMLEEVKKNARHCQDVRVISKMKIGQVARQGDIYLEMVPKIKSVGKPIKSRQLAPGTSKGSRHIVQDGERIKLFESFPNLNGKFQFQVGPRIESEVDFCVTHPEHATVKLPVGNFQVWFQADILRQQRVKD